MVSSNSQVDLLTRLLDVAHMRHEVIAQNVANINTPGYQRQDVRFEDAFARALEQGKDKQALALKPEIVAGAGGTDRSDGNNVDIDFEMGELNKNSLQYKVYTQILALQVAQMRSAISGK